MNNKAFKKYNRKTLTSGFTLIELLVVVSIIGLLSSMMSMSMAGAKQKARDVRRLADINLLVSAVQRYFLDNGVYPGAGDDLGVQISPDCSSGFRTDLITGEHLSEVPRDPREDADCNNIQPSYSGVDERFFYAWDADHCCGGSYCLTVNRIELDSTIKLLINKYPDNDSDASNGIQFVTGGGNANIGTGGDFNFCFVAETNAGDTGNFDNTW